MTDLQEAGHMLDVLEVLRSGIGSEKFDLTRVRTYFTAVVRADGVVDVSEVVAPMLTTMGILLELTATARGTTTAEVLDIVREAVLDQALAV